MWKNDKTKEMWREKKKKKNEKRRKERGKRRKVFRRTHMIEGQ